jgi:hypothetical protein
MAKAKRVRSDTYVTIRSVLGRKKADVEGTFERLAVKKLGVISAEGTSQR